MKLLGDCLIIGNRNFKLFSIDSYILSCYSITTNQEDYLFGDKTYRDVKISVYSHPDCKTLSRLFKVSGFEIVSSDTFGDIEEQIDISFNPLSLNTFKIPWVLGNFYVRLPRNKLGHFKKTIEKLSKEYSYKVPYCLGNLMVIL